MLTESARESYGLNSRDTEFHINLQPAMKDRSSGEHSS